MGKDKPIENVCSTLAYRSGFESQHRTVFTRNTVYLLLTSQG